MSEPLKRVDTSLWLKEWKEFVLVSRSKGMKQNHAARIAILDWTEQHILQTIADEKARK